jgi:glycosyltransferase involved in cell wall biosynthesis
VNLRQCGFVTVALLVPARAPALFLAETLDAVFAQEPAPDLVVVIDDGSQPPLMLHPDHADQCVLVRRETSGGPAAARADGLKAAGDVDLVALCDSDDVWQPGKLAAQRDALARHPGAALAFGTATIVGVDDRPTGERWEQLAPGPHAAAQLAPLLYERNPIPTSSVVMRRAALADAGGFPTPLRLAEDWDLWLRLLARGAEFVAVPEARIRYRRHPGGLTADIAALAESQLAMHERHAALVDEATARRRLAADHVAFARGHTRLREWRAARESLRVARKLHPATREERLLAAALAIPVARRALGRRNPYA